MSRQNPCTKTSVGSASSSSPKSRSMPSTRSTISTYRSTPSSVGTVRLSSNGRSPNFSSARGSAGSGERRRRNNIRSAVTPIATPVAATPTTAPTRPARRRNRPRSTTVVLPGDAHRTHPRDDLVVDGADRVGPVVGGRLATVAGSEKDSHVTRGNRVVTAVEHDLVHAHPARDGAPPPGQPDGADVGGVPRHPVAVAQRYDRERGVRRRGVRVSIGDTLTCGRPLRDEHPRAYRHRRPQPEALPRDRGQAVGRDPRAYQLEMRVRPGQRRGGVGQMAVARGEPEPRGHRETLVELRQLSV